MKDYSKEDFFSLHDDAKTPKRFGMSEKFFLQEEKRTINLGYKKYESYSESALKDTLKHIKDIFEDETKIRLSDSPYRTWWKGNLTDQEIADIKKWQKNHEKHLFIKSLLNFCIALDVNFEDPASKIRTEIGELDYRAKYSEDNEAVDSLTKKLISFIEGCSFYKNSDLIVAVPCVQSKKFDMSRELVRNISNRLKKPNTTDCFYLKKEKREIKKLSFEEKWTEWENTDIGWQDNQGISLKNKKVVLIDDQYQSGVTMNYIAMKLREWGVKSVCGLVVVKTMNDKDSLMKMNNKGSLIELSGDEMFI